MIVGLQAGHQNIGNNVDPQLRPETGATGEMPFNVKVRDALSKVLIAYGFQCQLDDANANSNPNTIGKDFAFYLAIHAEGAPPGGNIVAPDPSVDAATAESNRIVNAIKAVYSADTGIVNNGQVINNETFYYMWNVLTSKTPCELIECGDLADAHDSVILADIQRVADGIAHGLCNAFNIEWKGFPIPPAPPTPTVSTSTGSTGSTTPPVSSSTSNPTPTQPTSTSSTTPPVVPQASLLTQIHSIVWGNWTGWPLSKTFWRNNLLNLQKLVKK